MTTIACWIDVNQYSEPQRRSADRILDMLERQETRTQRMYSRLRKHPRKKFRQLIRLYLPPADSPFPRIEDSILVWCVDLSQSGASFLFPGELTEPFVFLGLQLPNQQVKWCSGKIVRRVDVPEEKFWTYGVCFQPLPTDN